MLTNTNILQLTFQIPVNLASVALGTCLGWTSPVIPQIKSNDTSVNPLSEIPTTAEESWIGSLVALGALIGNVHQYPW